ncbi:MAG: ABC transporter ATP-binding protein [Chloroflexi bacterium]|nr:ABC transporter ATP-binding protein [Chloroflexota bacterium]
MNDITIKVENLSKLYHIGQAQRRHNSLRDALDAGLRAPFHRLSRTGGDNGTSSDASFWALKDISFDVHRGEVIGIIGKNGAGKSTLLKILSRITEPTTGRARILGRVGSLLEVGTGFHPELTGRENIYLNGAILGMRRAEIDRKFDEIVAFAEVERFLDTPVKRYSSGMYVRLAFAVAAHLDPEVMIVDEVLAVGDVAFQRKCLGKMEDVARTGRTVLFVSHNIGAIIQLCSRVLVMDSGKCILDCNTDTAVTAYLARFQSSENTADFAFENEKSVQIMSFSVVSLMDKVISTWPHTQPLNLLVTYRVDKWPVGSYVCVDVHNETDIRLIWSNDVTSVDDMITERDPGLYQARVTIPGQILAPGRYYFTAAIYAPGRNQLYDAREKSISVEITDGGSFLSNFGIRPHSATIIPLSWETRQLARNRTES